MATDKQFNSFREFYPYYLTEHQDTACQVLHFAGTTLVFVFLALALMTLQWYYFVLIPVSGYFFAWIGHAFFEKNKPATFDYPLYSLGSDFVMYWHIITGQLSAKMKEAKKRY